MTREETFPRFDRMGESALLITFTQGISDAANSMAHALAESLREDPLRGVDDTVPAYSSLLVLFRPEVLSGHDLEAALTHRLKDDLKQPTAGKTLEVSVHYGGEDGPDITRLAELHGLMPDEVARLHTERPYRVYFIGFMPGFPYMGRVPRRLATPRLATPRVRIPAGSVGIAGSQTGIYPFASPGGWQIIGRTGLRLWNPQHKDPSLLLPGDMVQFYASKGEPDLELSDNAMPQPEHPVLEILEGPGITTVQDGGWLGYSQVGLSRGGAFDREAAARANALVGNEPEEALLELTWSGPTMSALQNVTIALDGADLGCRVDGESVPPRIAWFVRRGSTVRFSQPSPRDAGARAYLAVGGGVVTPRLLGSRSTYLPGGFGGLGGRALRAGDVIGSGPSSAVPQEMAGQMWPGPTDMKRRVGNVLRYTRYTGLGRVKPQSQATFQRTQWSVTEASDRMGIRLASVGDAPLPAQSREVVSFGVVEGAIQLPPAGTPIVLGPDHQTTGGYPLLGVVIEADFPLLAQLRPGDEVSFVEVTIEQALEERERARRDFRAGLVTFRSGW